MTKLKDLLLRTLDERAYAVQPEMDPLTEKNALQEAQLLDVRLDTVSLTVGILFELRLALQLREANTGVLVAWGVRELSWSGPSRGIDLTAWTVSGSVPRTGTGMFGLSLSLWPAPGANLGLVAETAAFFAGNVPSLDEVPPDYSKSDRTAVRAALADWESPFVPVHAVFLDRDPGG